MTPTQKRNTLLAEHLVKNLKRRHYNAYFCPTRDELLTLLKALIPEGSSITWGGTMTIRDTGIPAMLKQEGKYEVIDRDEVTTEEEKQRIYRKAFDVDYYLSSVNAMSEDGVMVNIDGNGNRVAAITWGPKHVIFVVGLNKVCQDTDAAIKRARSTAAPINSMRFDMNTPCQADGVCHDCLSPDSICTYISIQRLSRPAGRCTVILVGEELGY